MVAERSLLRTTCAWFPHRSNDWASQARCLAGTSAGGDKEIAARLAQTYPDTNADVTATVVPLRDFWFGKLRRSFWLLLGACGFVLLIACANVANLLMTQATVRERELVVRAALGASRGRLIRQSISEALLLVSLGCAGGIVLGAWCLRLLRPDGFRDVAIINRRLAERMWPNADPIGKRINCDHDNVGCAEIVGIAGDVKHNSLVDEAGYDLYYACFQSYSKQTHFVARTQGDPMTFAKDIQRAIWQVAPDTGVFNVMPVTRLSANTVWQSQVWGLLFGIFSTIALVLQVAGFMA